MRKQITNKEICICAACIAEDGTIFRGHRHHNCFQAMRSAGGTPDEGMDSQGFITSKNRYVTRREGYLLQIDAGIESVAPGGYWREELYSEDLY